MVFRGQLSLWAQQGTPNWKQITDTFVEKEALPKAF